MSTLLQGGGPCVKGKGCGMKWKKVTLHCVSTCLLKMLSVVVWIVR
jgi:hypothetical protein